MNHHEHRFIEALDVLFLRGNKLFGDPGSFGESLVPPWPSVVAGALRSRMLVDAGIDLADFASGNSVHPELGSPDAPGPFTVTAFQLARRRDNGTLEVFFTPPADLVLSTNEDGHPCVSSIKSVAIDKRLMTSSPLSQLPVLGMPKRCKPMKGYWLTESGWKHYINGGTPPARDWCRSDELWSLDHRVGVGLDTATRHVVKGRLFSMQAVAMKYGVGFLASVSGALPPASGMLRLGGDGRAAAIHSVSYVTPEPDYDAISKSRRCRLVLATPGIFSEGWKLPGTQKDGYFSMDGIRGHIVCAAVPRAETVSGWDMAQRKPKPAQKTVLPGTVYWMDDLEAEPNALRNLAEHGLWDRHCQDEARRAEGFNRVWLAKWN